MTTRPGSNLVNGFGVTAFLWFSLGACYLEKGADELVGVWRRWVQFDGDGADDRLTEEFLGRARDVVARAETGEVGVDFGWCFSPGDLDEGVGRERKPDDLAVASLVTGLDLATVPDRGEAFESVPDEVFEVVFVHWGGIGVWVSAAGATK